MSMHKLLIKLVSMPTLCYTENESEARRHLNDVIMPRAKASKYLYTSRPWQHVRGFCDTARRVLLCPWL